LEAIHGLHLFSDVPSDPGMRCGAPGRLVLVEHG
jgi:hypothetical protein